MVKKGVSVRSFFTNNEWIILDSWLESGIETQSTKVLFTNIRYNNVLFMEDLGFILGVTRMLRKMHEWSGRFTHRTRVGAFLPP